MAKVFVNPKLCKACEYCVSFCPKNVFALGEHANEMGYNTAVAVTDENCVGCLQCAVMCPEGAISVFK